MPRNARAHQAGSPGVPKSRRDQISLGRSRRSNGLALEPKTKDNVVESRIKIYARQHECQTPRARFRLCHLEITESGPNNQSTRHDPRSRRHHLCAPVSRRRQTESEIRFCSVVDLAAGAFRVGCCGADGCVQ